MPVHKIDGLRPTGDRVRETLFNWLADDINGANCLDLFAGSGALGFEAASRGAQQVTLLELHRQAAQQLQANQQLLKAENIQLVNTDALSWLSQYQQACFDIVFIDPPFAQNMWEQTLRALGECSAVGPSTLLYLEYPKSHLITLPAHWRWLKQKTAGDTGFGLASQH